MKPEVVTSLINITIPKKENNAESNIKSKTSVFPIIIAILIILVIIIYLVYNNIGKFLGYGTELICEKNNINTKLDATITRTVTIYYNRQGTREKIIDNTAYIFNNYTTYFEFKDKGEYFKYEPAGNPEGGTKWEDDTNTFRTIVNIDSDTEYYVDDMKKALSGNISEDLEEFQENSYICQKQSREE
jgi:hypothetical protein